MSEMFTKCNGFIVSGDPLVYADSATMTGQGTVSEPFGVKSTDLFVQEPLYTGASGNSAYIGWRPDETLLFSGSDAWGYGTIPLSESLKNFERIKVLATRAFTADGNTNRYSGPWSEFECDGIANTTAAWGAVTPAIYEGPWWKYSTFTANSTFTELKWFQGGYINVTNPSDHSAGTAWNDGKSVGIKAVVGINRKV